MLEVNPKNDLVEKSISMLKNRLPIKESVELPCEIKGECPYEYHLKPERDIEGYAFYW